MKQLLSVIIPCYNEQEAIPLFYKEINKISISMPQLDWEYLFVNDGSSDRTLETVKKLRVEDERVHYISFSRNFGKESAIYAGLQKAQGDYVVLMDVDLQDPPELIEEMYHLVVNEGYDCVATKRVTRKGEPFFRSLFARLFYYLINKISRTEFVDGARDFRLMKRQMVNSILELREYNRFSKGIFSWVGYKVKWLEYENVQRAAGETKWSFTHLFLYSLEGIFAFTTIPLAVASVLGIIFCLIAVAILILLLIEYFVVDHSVKSWTCLLCCICFLSGVQLFCTGIIGHYLARTYIETKHRPVYIVKEEA